MPKSPGLLAGTLRGHHFVVRRAVIPGARLRKLLFPASRLAEPFGNVLDGFSQFTRHNPQLVRVGLGLDSRHENLLRPIGRDTEHSVGWLFACPIERARDLSSSTRDGCDVALARRRCRIQPEVRPTVGGLQ